MMKRIPKKLLMIVGPLVFVAALIFFVLPKVSIQIGSAQPVATETATDAGGEHAAEVEEEKHGIPYPLAERVVNLADPGGYRYLKIEVVLDLYAEAAESGGGGGGGGGHGGGETDALEVAQTELKKQLGPVLPQMQDIVTTILTSKTVAEVSTAEGKAAVKAELLEALAPLLEKHHQELLAIYFQQFLIQ